MSGDTSYSPFGVPYAESGTVAASFTGKDQDTAPSLYDFPAREYGQVAARWSSPDPLDTGAFNLADPQTLDRYAYVGNEPMSSVDPLGTCENGHPCPPPPAPYQTECYTYPLTWGTSETGGPGGPAASSGVNYETGCVEVLVPPPPPGETFSVGGGAPGGAAPSLAKPQTQGPQSPQCTAAQRYAAQVGGVLQRTAEDFGLIAAGSGLATAIFGVGEGPTFGLDTAGTITVGAVTAFAGEAGFITGTAAAAFNSFANGNFNALSSFDLTRLTGLAASLVATKLPFVGRFAEQVGYAAEQATAAAQEAQAACQ